jgi:hypothetical protein
MEKLIAANTYDPDPSWEFGMRLSAAVGVCESMRLTTASSEPVATDSKHEGERGNTCRGIDFMTPPLFDIDISHDPVIITPGIKLKKKTCRLQ